jgi:hypothetical protein
MDFLKKLEERARNVGKDSEIEARKKYGSKYEEAGTLGRGIMRGISSGAFGKEADSPFSFDPGSPGSEMDLERFVSVRPGTPQVANPIQAYGNLFSAYGGRKMRGLLFD